MIRLEKMQLPFWPYSHAFRVPLDEKVLWLRTRELVVVRQRECESEEMMLLRILECLAIARLRLGGSRHQPGDCSLQVAAHSVKGSGS